MKNPFGILLLMTGFLLPGFLNAQGNLVFNGDFESGSTGWTLINGANTSLGGHPGIKMSLTRPTPSPSDLPTCSQMVSGLASDVTYLISGEYQAGKDRGGAFPTNASFGVAIDGNFVFEIAAAPGGDWQSFSFFYTASSSSALLSFSSQINGTGVEYAIDNIAMQIIPEPSAITLLLLGGGILCRIRRKRANQSDRNFRTCTSFLSTT